MAVVNAGFERLYLNIPSPHSFFADIKMGAKRVILRIPESEMNYQHPGEFVDFYFMKFPSNAASDPARHFIHYQPPNDIPHSNAKVHIVIDIETQEFAGELGREFPHEIYAVRRGAEQL